MCIHSYATESLLNDTRVYDFFHNVTPWASFSHLNGNRPNLESVDPFVKKWKTTIEVLKVDRNELGLKPQNKWLSTNSRLFRRTQHCWRYWNKAYLKDIVFSWQGLIESKTRKHQQDLHNGHEWRWWFLKLAFSALSLLGSDVVGWFEYSIVFKRGGSQSGFSWQIFRAVTFEGTQSRFV